MFEKYKDLIKEQPAYALWHVAGEVSNRLHGVSEVLALILEADRLAVLEGAAERAVMYAELHRCTRGDFIDGLNNAILGK